MTSQAPKKPKFRLIYLYLLVICVGFSLGNLAFNSYLYPKITGTPNNIPAKEEKQNIPVAIQKELPSPAIPNPTATNEPVLAPEPTLVLSGVFFEKDFGYALINNQIVKIGDKINQATVKLINLEGVELEFNGKPIKLSKAN